MPFVASAGRIAAVRAAPPLGWGTPLPAPVQIAPSLWQTYEQVWRAQPALRTVVGFLARNIAQLGLDPYRRLDDNDRVKDVRHPLGRLLENPFPGSKWTKYRLMSWTVHELCIHDDAYWVKARVGDLPALIPTPRRYIHPHGDNPLAPEKYRLHGERGWRDLDPDEVVHFHGYNPEDPRTGCAPIETLRAMLAEEWAAQGYREQMWRHGARMSGHITRPKDAPRWSDTARERFRREWRAQFTDQGVDAGGTPLLEDGMSFNPAGVTPKDAQYVESRRLTRLEVAVAYHVSPVMLGVLDEGATMSNVTELHKMLYQDTLGPWLVQLAQDLERQLLPDVDPAAALNGSVYVEFNLEEKLRGSFAEQAAAVSASVGGPWMTRAEARARANLRHLDGTDELIVPLNVVTGGLASPRDTAPDNPANEESNGLPPAARPAATRNGNGKIGALR